jgi:hypothetical protein
MEYSNFVPQGTKHRDLPSTCPPQYRSRIETLRNKPDDGKWREAQLDRCARVAREIALQDATPSSTQTEWPVVRQREPLSVESQPKLLKFAKLRQEIFEAELRYSDDQPRDEKGRFAGGGTSAGEKANDAKSHAAAATAHLNEADRLDENDDRKSQDAANSHFMAAVAHLNAAGVHNNLGASQSQKDQATKAAQAASKAANK